MTDGFVIDAETSMATKEYEQRVPDDYDGPRLDVRFIVDDTIPIADHTKVIPPKFVFGETKDGDRAYVEWLDSEGIPSKAWGTWKVTERGGKYVR